MTPGTAQHQPGILAKQRGWKGVDPGVRSLQQLAALVMEQTIHRLPVFAARIGLHRLGEGAVRLEQRGGAPVGGARLDLTELIHQHLFEVRTKNLVITVAAPVVRGVRKYLPALEFSDPYLTANVTVRDLLCHRTGIRPTNSAWYLTQARHASASPSAEDAWIKRSWDGYVAEKEILERLTGFSMYQGVLAIGKIPPEPNLRAILHKSARPCFCAAVDGLSNAENIGGLVRNCAAFGVQALLVGKSCGSPFLRRAVRSSMGAIFRLPVLEGIDLAPTLRDLRARGFRCIAAHPRSDKRTLAQADFTADCCLVFGSEGCGISPETVAACDEAVAIPMARGVDSLNVGCAAAVFFYEAHRQRRRQ